MGWKAYASALLAFNALGVRVVYALQRLQGVLPLNPQSMTGVSTDSSFNTAVSFVTNTNWQGYGGESTMSYLTQMLALDSSHYLRVYMRNLRHKLEDDPAQPRYLITETAVGYRLIAWPLSRAERRGIISAHEE